VATSFACILVIITGMANAGGQSGSVAESVRAPHDIDADTDPSSAFWREAPAVFAARDYVGNVVPAYRMEVRSRWTAENIYFLFVCPYEELDLKPDPQTNVETNELWNWAVAEAFIGSDFENIRRYNEFEVSPQAEWVDLEIDLDTPYPAAGWVWKSGMKAAARIDSKTRTWYAFMRIPYSSIDARAAAAGNLLRANFYLSEGAPPNHQQIAWQPTGTPTFHTPEAFGTLRLVDGGYQTGAGSFG
jgi:hypothetical protein